MILKKDLDVILLAISQYIYANHIMNPNISNHLKDYLIEVYDCDLITRNPINKHYKLEIIDNEVIVYLKLDGDIIKFVINKTNSYYTSI